MCVIVTWSDASFLERARIHKERQYRPTAVIPREDQDAVVLHIHDPGRRLRLSKLLCLPVLWRTCR